jgi:biopolymer transport protein ExbD
MATIVQNRTSPAPALAAEPNVIPFIDVLLVLLIIFMATAPSATVDLRLDLPRPSARSLDLAPVIVDVGPDGAGGVIFQVDARPIDIADLGAAVLASGYADAVQPTEDEVRANTRVFVRADERIAYTHVVAAIDALQTDGFSQVGLFSQRAQ